MADQTPVITEPTAPAIPTVPENSPQAPVVDPYENVSHEEALTKLKERDQSLTKLQDDLKQKETFIQQRNQQLGEARQYQQRFEVANAELAKARETLNSLQRDPNADKDAYADAKLQERQYQTEANAAGIQLAELQIKTAHPDFDNLLVTDIPEVMKAEGYTEAQINQMKMRYRADPQLAIQYADKAKMYQQNKKLQADLESARKAGDLLGTSVAGAASLAPGLGGGSVGNTSLKDPAKMTRAELNAEYDKLAAKGLVTPRKQRY